jgi:hypothetical protein
LNSSELVQQQLQLAIQDRTIQTALLLSDNIINTISDISLRGDDPDTELGGSLKPYVLSPTLWGDDWFKKVVEWSTSQASFDFEIAEPVVVSPQNEIVTNDTVRSRRMGQANTRVIQVKGPIVVLAADAAIGNMLRIPDLATPKEIQRFILFKNRVLDEVVLAAWRALAIARPDPDKLRARHVIDIMKNYMHAQGIEGEKVAISDDTLRPIASKIVTQLREELSSLRANLNSNQSRPKTR